MEGIKEVWYRFVFLLLVADAVTAMPEDLQNVKGIAIAFIAITVLLIILLVVLAAMYLCSRRGSANISFHGRGKSYDTSYANAGFRPSYAETSIRN